MSLFDQTDEQDPPKSYLEALVGEGKKFKTAEDLAKGKYDADRFIEHKNREFDEMREDLLKLKAENTAKDKWAELLAKRDPDDKPVTDTGTVENPSLKLEDIDAFLEKKLSLKEAAAKEKANMDKVENRLQERYGDNARKVLRDKMSQLGLDDEDLKFLAKKSPDAVFSALGLNEKQEPIQNLPRSSFRSDNFKPQTDIRDAVYYEKLRREDPKTYFSEKVSIQRLKDMDRPDFLTRYNQAQL